MYEHNHADAMAASTSKLFLSWLASVAGDTCPVIASYVLLSDPALRCWGCLMCHLPPCIGAWHWYKYQQSAGIPVHVAGCMGYGAPRPPPSSHPGFKTIYIMFAVRVKSIKFKIPFVLYFVIRDVTIMCVVFFLLCWVYWERLWLAALMAIGARLLGCLVLLVNDTLKDSAPGRFTCRARCAPSTHMGFATRLHTIRYYQISKQTCKGK